MINICIQIRAVYAYAYAYAYALYASIFRKTLTRTLTRCYEIRIRVHGRLRVSMKKRIKTLFFPDEISLFFHLVSGQIMSTAVRINETKQKLHNYLLRYAIYNTPYAIRRKWLIRDVHDTRTR